MKLTNEATTWASHGALRLVSSGDMRYSAAEVNFNGGWRQHLHAETGDAGWPTCCLLLKTSRQQDAPSSVRRCSLPESSDL